MPSFNEIHFFEMIVYLGVYLCSVSNPTLFAKQPKSICQAPKLKAFKPDLYYAD